MPDALSTYVTSSAGLLGAGVSYRPVLSLVTTDDAPYFDEGPKPPRARDNTDGSMNNLSSSYPYLQGVEVTRQQQYDAGFVKIWSGEPHHALRQNVFGQDRNFSLGPGFTETDLFDPVTYVAAQGRSSPLNSPVFTFPIVTGDNDQVENYNLNGIIEPLAIRPVIAFFSTDVPFESHAVRATMMCGNVDQLGGSDAVTTVDSFSSLGSSGFLDMVDALGRRSMNGFFRFGSTTLSPFVDERLTRNVRPSDTTPQDMVAAMSSLTGSSDSYIRHNERSATCGWYYENGTSMGTDSLAFGGMTH